MSVSWLRARSARHATSIELRIEAILENLAIASRRLTKSARRDAGGTVEGAHEVRQIGEADVERDIGDRALVVGAASAPRGAGASAPDIDAASRRARPQTRAGNETGSALPARRSLRDRLGSWRMRVDPRGRFHGAAAVARAARARAAARPEPVHEARRATTAPTSSSPASLRPSAAAWASSPSTISSGSGGTPPVRETPHRAQRSTRRSSGVKAGTTGIRRRRRDARACSMNSSPGWPHEHTNRPPARTTRRDSDSRSCPCARTTTE